MEGFRYFIFDLDGTLVDSLPGIAWSVEAAFAECGLTMPACDLQRSHRTADPQDSGRHFWNLRSVLIGPARAGLPPQLRFRGMA